MCCLDRQAVSEVPESIREWLASIRVGLPQALSGNIQIGIGTDAGLPGTDFNSALREMFALVAFGAPPLRALQAATLVPARALRLDRSLGYIKKGFHADILCLESNPLEDITAVTRPIGVVKAGHLTRSKINHKQHT